MGRQEQESRDICMRSRDGDKNHCATSIKRGVMTLTPQLFVTPDLRNIILVYVNAKE